jgi:hypothetical protein
MPNETCNHGNTAPQEILDLLPQSQAGTGHHKCAVCAYEEGFKAGKKKAKIESEPQNHGRQESTD